MEIQEFIQNFADQFDEVPTDDFTEETLFKDNDEWSSMTALSVIAMIDEVYAVRLTGDDIRKSNTIKDIYTVVVEKTDK